MYFSTLVNAGDKLLSLATRRYREKDLPLFDGIVLCILNKLRIGPSFSSITTSGWFLASNKKNPFSGAVIYFS